MNGGLIMNDGFTEFLRTMLPPFEGKLGEIQKAAQDGNYPIIPHETARFLSFLTGLIKPVSILEIGAAVGFSAALFCEFAPDNAHVTTIDRYDIMIEGAKKNFDYLGLNEKVTLLEGDAAVILPTLEGEYDFIFLDAAKGQYINFLNDCVRLLKVGGILAADDVLAAGGVTASRYETPRRQRTTHQRLRNFLWEINTRSDLETTIIPIGGGLALCRKKDW